MMKNIRMLDWLLVAAALTIIIAVLAPHQLPVTAYKLSLVSLAAVVGYRLDRSLFPYARPDRTFVGDMPSLMASTAMLRRAIIIAACIVGVSLGA